MTSWRYRTQAVRTYKSRHERIVDLNVNQNSVVWNYFSSVMNPMRGSQNVFLIERKSFTADVKTSNHNNSNDHIPRYHLSHIDRVVFSFVKHSFTYWWYFSKGLRDKWCNLVRFSSVLLS
ncbi:hypothetical protein ACOME3_005807 [Neoechinorhynchus agilis]